MKEKRSDLPDSIFGIPSQRKYPMQDKEHVLSAIKFFNYVDEDHEKELAKNIIKNMKKYDIPFDTVGKKNRLRNYIPKKYLEEKGLIHTLVRDGKTKKQINKYYKDLGLKGPNGYADLIKRFKGYNAGMMSVINKETDIEYLRYLRNDINVAKNTIQIIAPRVDKCIKLGNCKETAAYYKGITKQYIDQGITYHDCEVAIKGAQRMYDETNDRIKEVRKMIKDGTIKEDATGNAIVGTNQPDSVYIVNYMQRNAFSGELEEHKGVCKKNMKNIHVFNKVKKKLVPKSLDEFSSMIIGDISVIRTSATDFMHVIENATSENDIDHLIHDSEDPFVQEALDMSSPSEELDLLSEVQILKDAQQELLDSKRYNYRCELPVMETSFSPTNPYNFYTDINGYFIKNEVTGQRSASYFEQVDIPKSVLDHIISL